MEFLKHYMCKSLKLCLLSDIGYVSVSLKKVQKLSINENIGSPVETFAITVQNSAKFNTSGNAYILFR